MAGTFVVQTTCELEVVIDAACTFVMSSVDGGGGFPLFPATRPEQPTKAKLASSKAIKKTRER
ncbi:hypothetical protein AUG19_00450 [archaeon 13_1_20CM_2_54_9]|nr:MAG: hypothetical protein AUG19_00450 [archaeon 13_1_20CM_2_54_9]